MMLTFFLSTVYSFGIIKELIAEFPVLIQSRQPCLKTFLKQLTEIFIDIKDSPLSILLA
jgi:hypothetical protein